MSEKRSATIYQFPLGGRAKWADSRNAPAPVGEFPTNEDHVVVSSGWYHEEAIREEERARKSIRRFPTLQ